MIHKTRILIVTDSPVLPTGMAEATRLIFNTLLEKYPEHYDVHQIGLSHCYAVTTPKWPVYPTRFIKGKDGYEVFAPEDGYGEKTFPAIVQKIQPDIVFAFNDPQSVVHLCIPESERAYKLILLVNFDGFPTHPGLGQKLSMADLVITKSDFSRSVAASCLRDFPPDKLEYIYSPADVIRFHPLHENEKLELRRELFPDWMPENSFVLGGIGRNQWRKAIGTASC